MLTALNIIKLIPDGSYSNFYQILNNFSPFSLPNDPIYLEKNGMSGTGEVGRAANLRSSVMFDSFLYFRHGLFRRSVLYQSGDFILILLILFSFCYELQGNLPSIGVQFGWLCSVLIWDVPFMQVCLLQVFCMMKMNKH